MVLVLVVVLVLEKSSAATLDGTEQLWIDRVLF